MGADAATNAGYLTAMQAKYAARGKTEKMLKTALDKAKAENRDLTLEEKQQLMDANGGVFPPATSSLSSTTTPKSSSGKKNTLMFEKIEIINDRANVQYDDGLALQEATLMRKNERWFVACIKPIQIHY